jgi:hypothetical protein
MTFLERRDAVRSYATEAYDQVTWSSPGTLAELPVLPDWLVPYTVRNVFGELMEMVDDVPTPNRKVLAIITSTTSDVAALMQMGVARQHAGVTELPPSEFEACAAAGLMHQEMSPPDYTGMATDEVLDAELAMALQLLTYWVTQVLVVRLRELRLEERTRG